MTRKDPFLEGTVWDKFWRPIRSWALLFTPEFARTFEVPSEVDLSIVLLHRQQLRAKTHLFAQPKRGASCDPVKMGLFVL